MNAVSKAAAQILSIISHPLLVLSYGLILILAFNPFVFGVDSVKGRLPLILICLAYTFLLPLISIIFMALIGMIESIQMASKEERIGPLIICIVFYTWFYINMRRNPDIPEIFVLFSLGSIISLSLSFFVTIFSKISLHSVGAGGLAGLVLIMLWDYGYQEIIMFNLIIHIRFIFVIILVVSGLIGSARLWLRAHSSRDVFGGFLVGIASQFIALQILL